MTFVLDCSSIAAGLSGPLRVNCFGSRDIASVECIYDNGLIVEPCEHVKIQYHDIVMYIMESGEMEPYDNARHNLLAVTLLMRAYLPLIIYCSGYFWAIPIFKLDTAILCIVFC